MSSITSLGANDSGATSRGVINTNFTNLNTDKVEATGIATLTNKTIALGGNTISGTTAQFNAALTDEDFATLAGTETLTNKTLTSPSIATPNFTTQVGFGAKTAYFTETDNGNSSTADTIDWGVSNKQKSTLTGNCTFTFTAPTGPASLLLKLVQDATGSRTVTWPATVHWSGGTAPILTTTVAKVDIITFYWDGTTYFGSFTLNFTA